eukprot:scaffold148207_cov36-Tisochrysis_lutea.AAC.3
MCSCRIESAVPRLARLTAGGGLAVGAVADGAGGVSRGSLRVPSCPLGPHGVHLVIRTFRSERPRVFD